MIAIYQTISINLN